MPNSSTIKQHPSKVHARDSIPIIFGVTGHRDIPQSDVPALHEAVREYFKKVVEQYPNSEVVCLSALAEGADRIAARAAMDAGCSLGVFLPFAVDEYLNDFESEVSKQEFQTFLSKALFVEVAPRLVDSDIGNRDQGYVAVGVTIARYAQCLVALWDGITLEKSGGTSDIVRIYRTGIPAPRNMPDDIISALECGPVEHFWTRRVSSLAAIPLDKIGTREFLPPTPTGQSTDTSTLALQERSRWDRVFGCIDQFNLDAKSLPTSEEPNTYTQRHLISDVSLANQWPLDDERAKRFAWLFASADALSVKAQNARLDYFKQIIGLTLIAIFFEQLYSGPFALPVLLAISIGWALLATSRYLGINRMRLEEKYLDYRTLAEAARVQFFWEISGVPDCPADHYLRDQRDELEWLRQAVRAMDLPRAAVCDLPDSRTGLHITSTAWVKGQMNWFRMKAPDQATLAEKYTKSAGRWFATAIVAVLLTVVFHAVTNLWFPDLHELAIPSLPALYGMLFAVSGVIKLYADIMAHQEQSNRYRKMASHFGLCNERLDIALANGDIQTAQLIVLMIGRQALAENAEWLLLHRQRPIEVPI
jgi:hypothetical protein